MLNLILKTIAILFLFVAGCTSVDQQGESVTGYNFKDPEASVILPEILHEISGLTFVDSNTVACIQDENGILFLYDFVNFEIKEQFTFGPDGDYEGIARVADTIYVLRSDGMLFEIRDYGSKEPKSDSISTGIKAKNNEGLCYDEANQRLLIASKGKIGKGREYKNLRAVYNFELQTKTLATTLLYQIDLPAVKQYAIEKNVSLAAISTKKKKKDEGPNIKFNTSAISIHPVTKQLFMLSADDKLLFILSPEGHMDHIESLDPKLFIKAEGITFLENGDLLISNEGEDKKPTLLQFDYNPSK